jgi:uncharacterized protein with FMN-binding domain
MKKFWLSFFVVTSFTLYVLYYRFNNKASSDSTQVASSDSLNTTLPSQNNNLNNDLTVPIKTKTNITSTTNTTTSSSFLKDGEYTGKSVDSYYGYIQVKAVISNGKLADVVFLDYPQDRGNSIKINNHAMPILKSEAIKSQSSNVDTVSGATDSSGAFRTSLASALAQAKI